MTVMHRYRHGLTVRSRHLPEGRALVTWMLLPSVQRPPAVHVERVSPGDEWLDTVAAIVLIFVLGLLTGWIS